MAKFTLKFPVAGDNPGIKPVKLAVLRTQYKIYKKIYRRQNKELNTYTQRFYGKKSFSPRISSEKKSRNIFSLHHVSGNQINIPGIDTSLSPSFSFVSLQSSLSREDLKSLWFSVSHAAREFHVGQQTWWVALNVDNRMNSMNNFV